MLFAKRQTDIKFGLSRMKQAKELIFPNLHRLPPVILIGGTNGKGTCAGLLWHLCANVGMNVGLYTSPHILEFRERFQVSKGCISNDELDLELQKLQV